MELRFDAILYSTSGNENSDADHIKCSRGPQVPHPWCRGWHAALNTIFKVRKLMFGIVVLLKLS